MIRFLYGAVMQVGLRHFDSHTLDWLVAALRSGEHTRHALARELCARTGWLNALGRPCLSAPPPPPALAERIGIELPPARDRPDPAAAPAAPAGHVPDTRLACAPEDLGPVSLDLVGDTDDRRLWEAMMETHHPLGWARPPGGQMRYWIRPERHGVPGGIGFGSAAWRLRARDEWIGWSADARAANIGRVIRNHRYRPLPGVRVHGLASGILRMAADTVADDREARYSVRPVASYTHVGPAHSGYRYHCAGRAAAGRAGGRGNGASTVRAPALEDGWWKALGETVRRPVGALAGAYDGTDPDWAERAYGRTGHTDGRVRRRIVVTGRSWLKNMGEDLPAIFPTKAEQRAAYRLLSNPRISMEHVLEPHFEATADRCRAEPVVLAIQDTTALDYTGLEATAGLDGTGGGGKGSVGILAHAGLAATPQGLQKSRPVSVIRMACMAGHAGRSPPLRSADAWLAGRGAPLRRHGPPRAGPRAGRADRLARRVRLPVPVGGGEGAAGPGGAAGAGASAATRRSRPGRRTLRPGRRHPRHGGGPACGWTGWRRRSCAWPPRGWRTAGRSGIRSVPWRPAPTSARSTPATAITGRAGPAPGAAAAAGRRRARCASWRRGRLARGAAQDRAAAGRDAGRGL